MEPHVFCGPEFILLIPTDKLSEVTLSTQQNEKEGDANNSNDNNNNNNNNTSGAAAGSIAPSVLLSFQRALHSLCSPTVRRCLARLPQGCAPAYFTATPANAPVPLFQSCYYSSGLAAGASTHHHSSNNSNNNNSAGGKVPEAPAQLEWLEVRPTAALTTEEKQSIPLSVQTVFAAPGLAAEVMAQHQVQLVYLTDSRLAAQVHLLALRSGTIALPHGCQLLPYVRATARAQTLTLAAISKKREAVRAHYNIDGDLWADLQEALQTQQLPEKVLQAYDGREGAAAAPRLRTTEEDHQRCVGALLYYCEREVQYAGVLNNEGQPSPFLLALGLCLHYELTLVDLLAHLVRHPRRLCRALALFYVRYLLPPEELMPFFIPSIGDQVVITTTEDLEVTLPMAALCRALLEQDEVGEAWLPTYHPYWRQRVVAPLLTAMTAFWEAGGAERAAAPPAPTEAAPAPAAPAAPAATKATGKGSAKGIAAQFGFHSLKELDAYARAHREVTLVPQSMSVLLAKRQTRAHDTARREQLMGTGDGGESGSADSVGGDSDHDDFMIDVEVEGSGGTTGGAAPFSPASSAAAAKRPRSGAPPPPTATAKATTDAAAAAAASEGGGGAVRLHKAVRAEGYKVVMELLGRHRPFDAHDECYLDF